VTAREIASHVLVWIGCGGLALACLGALALRDVRDRVHALAVAVVCGVIPVAAGLVLTSGSLRSGAKIVIIALLLVATAPATSAATGHAVDARREEEGA
jgi:multisubunit Na+/H+ antiporter MnhG subunit